MVTGIVKSNKWGEVRYFIFVLSRFCSTNFLRCLQLDVRPLTAPVFKSVMFAGTPAEASYLWALFYLLALKMLEHMTNDILMGKSNSTSWCAIRVLGKAAAGKSIDRFQDKFRYCLGFALTNALVGDGQGPLIDLWDFKDDDVQITSKQHPFCRWLWAELTRVVSSILVHICDH